MIERFNKFAHLLQLREPKLKIAYKNESAFMKILGKILFFNPGFMTNFITTIGYTVYFPSREIVETCKDFTQVNILAHEFIHISDYSKNKLFPFLYLLPLILAPFMLFFIFLKWWLGLALFVFFLLPLPAFFRMKYELKAYIMSLIAENEINKELNIKNETIISNLNNFSEQINKFFTGPAYYFMWIFGVKKKLNQAVQDITNNQISEPLYLQVLEDLKNSKNL